MSLVLTLNMSWLATCAWVSVSSMVTSNVLRWTLSSKCFPAIIYLFKINNRNTRKRCEICSKLTTMKTLEWRHWRHSGVFIVNFEQVNVSWVGSSLRVCEEELKMWSPLPLLSCDLWMFVKKNPYRKTNKQTNKKRSKYWVGSSDLHYLFRDTVKKNSELNFFIKVRLLRESLKKLTMRLVYANILSSIPSFVNSFGIFGGGF